MSDWFSRNHFLNRLTGLTFILNNLDWLGWLTHHGLVLIVVLNQRITGFFLDSPFINGAVLEIILKHFDFFIRNWIWDFLIGVTTHWHFKIFVFLPRIIWREFLAGFPACDLRLELQLLETESLLLLFDLLEFQWFLVEDFFDLFRRWNGLRIFLLSFIVEKFNVVQIFVWFLWGSVMKPWGV